MTNRLFNSTSAYLLQHATNPVDWWPWGQEAFDEADRLDRPVFLSIGYAACHWCHVMAHESFENPDIATMLNEGFISIKVDREERPDVDAVYMAATQLVSGHGGWPMSVFLLPDKRPFMAGTYYPPREQHGHVSFPRLLRAMRDAWDTQRAAVLEQAEEISRSLARETSFIDHLTPFTETFDLPALEERLRSELVAHAEESGGFGPAPKFPRPSFVVALLSGEVHASAVVEQTLDAMSRQGLYDHIEGGFARYSVDAQWHVPHFEKMLSDQALLARCFLSAAERLVGRDEWREVALATLRYVIDAFAVPGGFASSLDADAGGVEGSHITWTPDEVRDALSARGLDKDLDACLARWRISTPGEFEGRSIPRLADGAPFTCPSELRPALEAMRSVRSDRPQPGRDEKIILEWNAMFASALLASREPDLVDHGLNLLASLHATHFGDGVWWRTTDHRAYAGAADVAWLIDSNLDAFELTGDDTWRERAHHLAQYLMAHFWDGEQPTTNEPDIGHGVFAQCDLVSDTPTRPKEIFDGATPSSHAVACRALARLGLIDGGGRFLVAAQRLAVLAGTLMSQHPMAVPDLIEAAAFAFNGIEIVVPGEPNELSNHVRLMSVPASVLVTGFGSSALLANRREGLAYVCRAGVCRLPASSVEELDTQLKLARS